MILVVVQSVYGPFSILEVSTKDIAGSFKLLRLMERVKAYGRDIYWPWIEKYLLEPLVSGRQNEPLAEDGGMELLTSESVS